MQRFIALFILGVVTAAMAAEPPQPGLAPLIRALGATDDPDIQLDILRGLHLAFQGRRDLKMPAGWADTQARLAASSHAEVRRLTLVLSVLFGDARALTALRDIAASGQEAPEVR